MRNVYNSSSYTSQRKHLFQLENVSRVESQNSLPPRETTTLNFRLACDQVVHPETAANLLFYTARNKYFFRSFFPILELGGIRKHFVTGAMGKQGVLFALDLGLASGTTEGLGATKLTASLITFLSLRFTLLILTDQEHDQVTQTYQMLD